MYIAYVNQTDLGCDYTIACGKTLWYLESEEYEDAIEELKKKIIGEWDNGNYEDGYWDEYELISVTLFESPWKEEMPLGDWYKEAKVKMNDYKFKVATQLEKNEYERLKKKYG